MYGGLWPEDCGDNWFEDYMKKPGVAKFYQTNANSEDGLKLVAKHYGVTQSWNQCDKRDKKLWQLTTELAKLVRLEGNENKNYFLQPIEGNQRNMSLVHYSVLSPHDTINGTLNPGALKMKGLAKALKNVPTRVKERPPDLEALNEEQRKNGTGNGMHDTAISITVDYVSDLSTNAEALCGYARIISDNISKQKHESASKDIMVLLKENVITPFLDEEMNTKGRGLIDRPDYLGLDQFKQGKTIYKKAEDVRKQWDPENEGDVNEREKFTQWPTVLDKPEYEQYIQNILDTDARMAALDLFKVGSVPDEYQMNNPPAASAADRHRSPPFVPTLDTQAFDALGGAKGKKTKQLHCLSVNAKTANNYFLCPPTLLILYAAMHNVTVEEAQMDNKFQEMLKYYLRYCVHGNLAPNSVDLHGAWKHIHNCGAESNTYTENGRIIGATLFITEMINSVITRELQLCKDDITKRGEMWNSSVKMLKDAILIMGDMKEGQKNEHTINVLGKSDVIYSC